MNLYTFDSVLDARSTCLERGGDLLTITNEKERKAVAARINSSVHDYYWISLNGRDYPNIFDWANGAPNGFMNWGSGDHYFSMFTTSKCLRMKWELHP